MDLRRGLILAVLVAALAFPQAVQAATTRHVPSAAYPTIASAVTAAADGDTIDIAAGTYAEAITTTKNLNFVGAGSAATVIAAPAGGTALNLKRGGSVSSLRAAGGSSSSGGTAIVLAPDVDGSFSYSLTNVVGQGGDGSDPAFGFAGSGLQAFSSGPARIVNLNVSGSTFRAGTALIFLGYGTYVSGAGVKATLTNTSVVGAASGTGIGLLASSGPTVKATGLTAQGTYAVQVGDATLSLVRSSVEARYQGLSVFESATAPATNVSVTDSLIVANPTSATDAVALSAQTSSGSAALTVPVRGSTIVARGVDPLYAVVSRPLSGAPSSTIDLRNSIARLEGGAETGEADVAADRGTVTADHSDFATRLELNGGSVTAPGSGTNLTADPLFNPGAFTLKASSPLIDRGDPALVEAGQLDLAGRPRSAGVAPDIGAFEYHPPAPPQPPPPPPVANTPPKLGKVSMTNSVFAPVAAAAASPHRARGVKRGTTFRYTLSEASTVSITVERRARGRRARSRARGRCVRSTHRNRANKACTRWLRAGVLESLERPGRQSTFFTGRLRKRALKPGRYRARIVAKDGAGARSRERRLSFRIVRAR